MFGLFGKSKKEAIVKKEAEKIYESIKSEAVIFSIKINSNLPSKYSPIEFQVFLEKNIKEFENKKGTYTDYVLNNKNEFEFAMMIIALIDKLTKKKTYGDFFFQNIASKITEDTTRKYNSFMDGGSDAVYNYILEQFNKRQSDYANVFNSCKESTDLYMNTAMFLSDQTIALIEQAKNKKIDIENRTRILMHTSDSQLLIMKFLKKIFDTLGE